MLQDLRYACRVIRKSPGFAAIVIFTLALGIGANTAVFSVVRGVLLQPPPYKDPARLVEIFEASLHNPSINRGVTPYSDFEEYSQQARSFEKIAFVTLWSPWNLLTGRGPARRVASVVVNEDFFATLGVSAARGRTFERGDLLHGCSVVLNDGFWRSTLGGDPAMVGKSIELNHHACTVLGIMPAGFDFFPPRTPLWVLLTTDDPRPRDQLLGNCIARLKPGVTMEQAKSELAALRQRVRQADAYRDYAPVVLSLREQFLFQAGKNLPATLGLLAAAVALVLFIACLNVANLLLARSSARTREFAVRAALGSGRARLVRQLLVEGLLLAGIGGAAGAMVALGLVKYFLHANPIQLPIGSDVSVNLPVLLFTALLTMATAMVFGIAPAWSGARTGVNHALHAAGRGSISSGNRRLTRVLITAGISLSLMLLSGASLLMRSVLKMGTVPLGFDPEHLVFTYVLLPERYSGKAEELGFYEDLRTRLNAIPGVEGSAFTSYLPLRLAGAGQMEIDGRSPTGQQDVAQNIVSPDYFQVLRVALRRGRVFGRQDRPGSPAVAVVNEAFANEYLAGADPIGQRVRIVGATGPGWLTVVGVVATEKQADPAHEMTWHDQAILYRPLWQEPLNFQFIALRTRGDQAATGRAVERIMQSIDSDIPIAETFTPGGLLADLLAYPHFRAMVIGAFAGLALLLATLGLYGLLSQYVTQRTRELGLRMAIGARTRDIVRLVAVQGGIPVLVGLALGMALSTALAGYLTSLLFGVTRGELWTVIGAPVLLLVAAVVAMAKPALDATSVDPVVALRDE